MSSPVVTVIVPGRDVAAFAPDALASLRAQTRPDWRAILIDDGSIDETSEVFRAAAADDDRFTVVRHPEPRGLGAARNTGLDLVETPLVAFLDADDEYTPTALERLTSTLLTSGSDLVVGAYVRLRPQHGVDGAVTYTPGEVQPWVSASTAPERRGTTLADHPEVSGNIVAWSKVSRIEFWRRHGLRFPEGSLYEDQIVAQRMYSSARAIDTVPDVVVRWRERADGSSITQHRDEVPVLRDYLDALGGGLAVLDAASQRAASRARVRLILEMDLPPLIAIARDHPDPAYRRAVGALVRELHAREGTDGIPLDPETRAALAAARLW